MEYNTLVQVDFFSSLQYKFQKKPLLIGGMAMEFYNLRKAGNDIDFVVDRKDWDELAKAYPGKDQNLYGDKSVGFENFEFWTCIRLFDYTFLKEHAIEKDAYLVVSLEKLLFLKAITAFDMHTKEATREKSLHDLPLIVKKINDIQYGKDKLEE